MVGLQPDQYYKVLSIILRERASQFYYINFAGKGYTFDTMIHQLRVHFETEENRQLYMSEWRETTLRRVIIKNPTKIRLEYLQLLFNKL